jgi:hypothetical protein
MDANDAQLWESNPKPHLYRFTAKFLKRKGSSQPSYFCPSPCEGKWRGEMDLFMDFFKKKTGVDWLDRITYAYTGLSASFQYTPPVRLSPNFERHTDGLLTNYRLKESPLVGVYDIALTIVERSTRIFEDCPGLLSRTRTSGVFQQRTTPMLVQGTSTMTMRSPARLMILSTFQQNTSLPSLSWRLIK